MMKSYPLPCFSIFLFFLFSFHFYSQYISSINTPKNLTGCPFFLCSQATAYRELLSLSLPLSPFLTFFTLGLFPKSKMSRRTSKRVSFSPDINERPTICPKHGGSGRTRSGNRRRVIVGLFTFRVVKSARVSPVRLLRRIGAKVARALRFVSMRRSNSSHKGSSSKLARSRSLAESIDSHRAEAIEDCIEFLNSSSSLSRSNSVSTCSC